MQDLMIDDETGGTRPGSAVVSIGAVFFDPRRDELGPEFYGVATLASCLAAGLTVDAETMCWWMKQSDEARAVFNDPSAEKLGDVLCNLTHFAWAHCPKEKIRVWGNGSPFDNVLTRMAYAAISPLEPFWEHVNDRCYRTLKNQAPEVKLARVGVAHHALDDAKSQAHHAIRLMRAIDRDGEGRRIGVVVGADDA